MHIDIEDIKDCHDRLKESIKKGEVKTSIDTLEQFMKKSHEYDNYEDIIIKFRSDYNISNDAKIKGIIKPKKHTKKCRDILSRILSLNDTCKEIIKKLEEKNGKAPRVQDNSSKKKVKHNNNERLIKLKNYIQQVINNYPKDFIQSIHYFDLKNRTIEDKDLIYVEMKIKQQSIFSYDDKSLTEVELTYSAAVLCLENDKKIIFHHLSASPKGLIETIKEQIIKTNEIRILVFSFRHSSVLFSDELAFENENTEVSNLLDRIHSEEDFDDEYKELLKQLYSDREIRVLKINGKLIMTPYLFGEEILLNLA